jgi:bifunctional enzyme CysN/CysC
MADRRLLRVMTCGSVDDGKSTLIGRLIADAGLAPDDVMAAALKDSAGDDLDPSLLLDGLEAEREQGVTIDVAHRFFSTAARAFIIADSPGHPQFTRNMATAASTADVAVLLCDVRQGLLDQTRRHALICALMGVKTVVLAVNKMDLAGYAQIAFNRVSEAFSELAGKLGFTDAMAIPVAARAGDMVAHRGDNLRWWRGPTLLEHLETLEPPGAGGGPFRFPVQWVNRADGTIRGLAGTVAGGAASVGATVETARSGQQARIARIITFDGDRTSAAAGDAVTLVLDREIETGRGEILCDPDARPHAVDQFEADLIWLDESDLLPGRSYLLQVGAQTTPARVTRLNHKLDMATLAQRPAATLELNDIGSGVVAAASIVAFDLYDESHATGAFILIDRDTQATAGAGMIRRALPRVSQIYRHASSVTAPMRARSLAQTPVAVWFTGLSGSGKSTIANLVDLKLAARGLHAMLLDGDNLRSGLTRDLGFSPADRVENIRRASEVSRLMTDAGLIVLASFIAPFAAERRMAREIHGETAYLEVFIDTPLDLCINRDPKGLYRRALAGGLRDFTGVSAPYEAPLSPDVRIDGASLSAEAAAEQVLAAILSRQTV